jgi:hypothetical protein
MSLGIVTVALGLNSWTSQAKEVLTIAHLKEPPAANLSKSFIKKNLGWV